MAERIAAAMEPKQSKIDKQAKAAFERTMETLRLMYQLWPDEGRWLVRQERRQA